MVVDEEMRPRQWPGLMLCVAFSALMLMLGWQEGHVAHINAVPLIPTASLQEQVE